MARPPVRPELAQHLLREVVDRHGERDPDVGVDARARDLRAHPDHPARRVEQRAARVAVVQRGVRLDRVGDRPAARRLDLALEPGDDAGARRPLEPERVADREDRLSDCDAPRRAERERMQSRGGHVDVDDREVGRRVCADQRALGARPVGEPHVDRRRVAHHVRARHDRPVGVQHEPGARRRRLLPALRRAGWRGHLDHGRDGERDRAAPCGLGHADPVRASPDHDRGRGAGRGRRRLAGVSSSSPARSTTSTSAAPARPATRPSSTLPTGPRRLAACRRRGRALRASTSRGLAPRPRRGLYFCPSGNGVRGGSPVRSASWNRPGITRRDPVGAPEPAR